MPKPDHTPDMSDLLATLRSRIDKNGFTYQFVSGDEDSPPYIYTIGLTETYKHPEIHLVGLPPEHAMPLIDELVERIAGGERFDAPQYIEDLIHFDMPIRPMTDAAVLENAGTGWEVLGGAFKAVQLFYPDKNGYAPWEPECAPHYADPQLYFELEGEPPVRTRPLVSDHDAHAVPQSPLTSEEIAERRKMFTQKMRDAVEKDGFTFQPVMGGDGEPSYFYSIGLSKTYNHPEIYIVGLEPQQAHGLMLDIIFKIVEGKRFDKPCYVSDVIEGDLGMRPLVTEDVDQHSGIGQEVLGGRFEAVQLYYPDPHGLFPWEAGCDRSYAEDQLSMFRPVGDPPERLSPTVTGTVH